MGSVCLGKSFPVWRVQEGRCVRLGVEVGTGATDLGLSFIDMRPLDKAGCKYKKTEILQPKERFEGNRLNSEDDLVLFGRIASKSNNVIIPALPQPAPVVQSVCNK